MAEDMRNLKRKLRMIKCNNTTTLEIRQEMLNVELHVANTLDSFVKLKWEN